MIDKCKKHNKKKPCSICTGKAIPQSSITVASYTVKARYYGNGASGELAQEEREKQKDA